MGLHRKQLWLALTLLAAASGLMRAADEPKPRPAPEDRATAPPRNRSAAWPALLKAWPYQQKKIEVYAENPSGTEICFRSGGQTYLFTIRTGKAHLVEHAKVIAPEINCITFEKGNGALGGFVLWHYGEAQLSVGADH
jgi:hypothetical protein